MLELKTKKQLAEEAFTLAQSYQLVRYRSITYIPADFETGATDVPPGHDRTIWQPLNRAAIQGLAAAQFDTLFGTDAELSAFDFMVAQSAIQMDKDISSLLVRTSVGLRELTEAGQLEPATGEFRPNYLMPMLSDDAIEKGRVFDVIAEWVDSTEEAESLLTHLATSLAPGWSAVKYVLLLGEGRNGKGLLLKMLKALFGPGNCSGVTRQMMAEQKAPVMELNGKLINLVFDGPNEYLKDSGTEKTLVAGEPVAIEAKYKNEAVTVQTNALFVEALNDEPKSKDKSTALQKRLVRFLFPNVYAKDLVFERQMLSEESLGAFLGLLIDRYVKEDELAVRLAPTSRALELQLEHMYSNSIGLQFLKHLEEDPNEPLGAEGLIGEQTTVLQQKFRSWRLKENDLGTWAEPDVLRQFTPLINTKRKSDRQGTKVVKVRVIESFKPEATAFIESLKGDDDAALIAAVVED